MIDKAVKAGLFKKGELEAALEQGHSYDHLLDRLVVDWGIAEDLYNCDGEQRIYLLVASGNGKMLDIIQGGALRFTDTLRRTINLDLNILELMVITDFYCE